MNGHDVNQNGSSNNNINKSSGSETNREDSSSSAATQQFLPATDEQVMNLRSVLGNGTNSGIGMMTRTTDATGSSSDIGCSLQQEGLDEPLLSGYNNNNHDNNNEQCTTTTTPTTTNNSDSDTSFVQLDIEENNNDDAVLLSSNNPTTITPEDEEYSYYSLAHAPSMSRWIRISFSCLALLAHGLFLYGQTAPMWRLVAMGNVDVWANATTAVSRSTFDAVGMNHTTHLSNSKEKELDTFTYFHGVEKLWKSGSSKKKKISWASSFLPRLSAVLLVFASGIWPHLKLLLLQGCWFFPRSEKQRTKELYWLGALGKWSMADIFVVCIMVAVVNIHWDMDPVAMKEGVMSHLPTAIELAQKMYTTKEACAKLLHFPCDGDHVPWNHQAQCWSCEVVVDQAFGHPGWAEKTGKQVIKGIEVSGGGTVDMRVEGMRGVYFFCAAVILSLLLGVYADVLDHRSRTWSSIQRGQQQQQQQQQHEQYEQQQQYDDRLHPFSLWDRIFDTNSTTVFSSRTVYIQLIIAVLITAVIVVLAAFLPTMERRVLGPGPTLIQDMVGIEFRSVYSFRALGEVTGAAGGWDKMLMATFMVFTVIGPVIRGILCVLYLLIPWTEAVHRKLLFAINFVGSFCAWEVFTLALFMVGMQMPSQTSYIFKRRECKYLNEDGGSSCLQVEFTALHSYAWTIIVGGFLLVLVSVISVKLGFIAFDPYNDGDKGGPYWFDCCCCPKQRQQPRQQHQFTEEEIQFTQEMQLSQHHTLLLQQEPAYDPLTTSES